MPRGSDPRDDSLPSESLMGNVEGRPSEESAEKNRVPSDTLRRAPHIVILALLYAMVAIFAWAVLCILTHRPIGARSYQPNLGSETELEDYMDGAKGSFGTTERLLRASRVCQSLASVLTIPLTSMVCSCAAVAFLQRRAKQSWHTPTLRQSMALADKGWNDPVLITKLITGGWKRYGSVFLIFALVLNLIGASIAPFQGLFVSYKSIKVPTKMSSMDLIDLEKWITWAADPIHDNDAAEPATKLRSRLISTSNSDPQFRLWSRGEGCTNSTEGSNQACNKSGQSTFGIMPNISDPFWAQPPVGFQTGLWQQFAPRVNFTTKYDKILADDFPKGCKDEPGALSIHYENMTDIGGYIVDICMPGDQKQSPWKATRKRPDFSEELYVKMTLDWKGEYEGENELGEYLSFAPGNYSFKVTLNTTAGYFELPNYQNGQLPGPLLDDPDNGQEKNCGAQCRLQSQKVAMYQKKRYFVGPVTNSTEVALANLTGSLSSVVSKGPLLYTTLALFTTGSYLDIEHTAAQAYHNGGPDEWGGCIDIPPLVQLLHGEDDNRVSLEIDPCIDGANTKGLGLLKLVADYIWLFSAEERSYYTNVISPSAKHIENAFTAAAFMAVDEWMQYASMWSDWDTSGSLNWDLGVDQDVPSISRVGVVFISILLALYLLCILGLSLYAAWTPRWTNQLDSFAMMRIGSAAPDRFPLRLAHSSDEVNDLDQLPGWIGSTTGVETDKNCVSELGLGGEAALEGKKRYRCYASGEPS